MKRFGVVVTVSIVAWLVTQLAEFDSVIKQPKSGDYWVVETTKNSVVVVVSDVVVGLTPLEELVSLREQIHSMLEVELWW